MLLLLIVYFRADIDSFANPIIGSIITVSGGYGANVTGSTDCNGYYALSIKPVNIGGPFALSFAVTSALGDYNTIQGDITVTAPIVVPVDKVLAGTVIAEQTGTMPNNGALSYNPSTISQNIPAGYTSGGTIAPVIGTATASDVKSGKTFFQVVLELIKLEREILQDMRLEPQHQHHHIQLL